MAWKPLNRVAQEYGLSKATLLRWIHVGGLEFRVKTGKKAYYIDDEDPTFQRLLSFHKTKSVNGKLPMQKIAQMYNIPITTLYFYTVEKKTIPYEEFIYLNKKYILIDPDSPELKKLVEHIHSKTSQH